MTRKFDAWLRTALRGAVEPQLISPDSFERLERAWHEPHRCYHGADHLRKLAEMIVMNSYLGAEADRLLTIALFHDAVYDPYSSKNEQRSADLYKSLVKPEKFDQVVYDTILDTTDHTKMASSQTSLIFLELDLHTLLYGTVDEMIADSKLIMREYGKTDWTTFKQGRLAFMQRIVPHLKKINPGTKIDGYVAWLTHWTPRIAAFAGTFNPFHRGHLDVLQKAERMFDKVIVVAGVNPNKEQSSDRRDYLGSLEELLPNNQIESFGGFLTDWVRSQPYPITIVKGLRNPSDFDSEKLQLRYMEDLDPEISISYVISDRKWEHVSSSGIKMVNAIELASRGTSEETKKYRLYKHTI